jgi:hypothetical protein
MVVGGSGSGAGLVGHTENAFLDWLKANIIEARVRYRLGPK